MNEKCKASLPDFYSSPIPHYDRNKDNCANLNTHTDNSSNEWTTLAPQILSEGDNTNITESVKHVFNDSLPVDSEDVIEQHNNQFYIGGSSSYTEKNDNDFSSDEIAEEKSLPVDRKQIDQFNRCSELEKLSLSKKKVKSLHCIANAESVPYSYVASEVLGSYGSNSENMDSLKTVLEVGQEKGKDNLYTDPSNILLPSFCIGGVVNVNRPVVSPKVYSNDKDSVENIAIKDTSFNAKSTSNNEPESSISIESANPPESSERGTSPSVHSVSSATSSKKLEWDSGADVGYSKEKLVNDKKVLSTLEKMAIVNYADIFRTEPDGTNSDKKQTVKACKSNINLSKFQSLPSSKNIARYMHSQKYSLRVYPKNDQIDLDSSDENGSNKVSPRPIFKRKVDSCSKKHLKAISLVELRYKEKNVYSKMEPLSDLIYKDKCSVINKNSKEKSNFETTVVTTEQTVTEDTEKHASTNSLKYSTSSLSTGILSGTTSATLIPDTNAISSNVSMENISKCNEIILDINPVPVVIENNVNVLPAFQKSLSEADSKNGSFENFDNESLPLSNFFTINKALKALSNRLSNELNCLKEGNFYKNNEAFINIQEYIRILGLPSGIAEEVNFKRDLAKIILRMFGQHDDDDSGILKSCHSDLSNPDDDAGEQESIECHPSDFQDQPDDTCDKTKHGLHVNYSSESVNLSLSDSEEIGIIASNSWQRANLGVGKEIYRDCHGNLHVAHRPPGNSESESVSENEYEEAIPEVEIKRNGLPVLPWTSTGSESAYETIRERNRHVDEELASSFEFFSTSPRDARILGYVSSEDSHNNNDGYIASKESNVSSSLQQDLSDKWCSSIENNGSSVSKSISKYQSYDEKYDDVAQLSRTDFSVPHSQNHRIKEDISTSVSIIQLKKHKYVKRIQRHIKILEKLEKALSNQLGGSLHSDSYGLKRCATEGCSHTDSDVKLAPRDILGQSGTPTSGQISSDITDEIISSKKSPNPYKSKTSNVLNIGNGLESSSLSSDHMQCTSQTYSKRRHYRRPRKQLLLTKNKVADVKNKQITKLTREEPRGEECPDSQKPIPSKISSTLPSSIDVNKNQGSVNANVIETTSSQEEVSRQGDGRETKYISKPSKYSLKSTSNISNSASIVRPSKTIAKQSYKNFAQMFPSPPDSSIEIEDSCFLNAPSVGIQTGDSLLNINCGFSSKGSSTSLATSREIVGDDNPLPPAPVFTRLVHKIQHSGKKGIDNNKVCSNLNVEAKRIKKLEIGKEEKKVLVIKASGRSMDKDSSNDNEKSDLSDQYELPILNKERASDFISENKESNNAAAAISEFKNKEYNYASKSIRTPSLVPINSTSSLKANAKMLRTKQFNENTQTKVLKKAERFDIENKENSSCLINGNVMKTLSLQEALLIARPKYVKSAEKRRQKIKLKHTLRKESQEHNHVVFSQIPQSMQTPNTLRRFLVQPGTTPLFTYKEMRCQNKKLCQLLPESQLYQNTKKRKAISLTNRMMANLYSQRLKTKVLSGKVTHAHRHVVTPIR